MSYRRRIAVLVLLVCILGLEGSLAARANEGRAIRLAWRLAFEQDAHHQLKAMYPGVRWKKPASWKWTVQSSPKNEEDAFLLRLEVRGRARSSRGFLRKLVTAMFFRFPFLQVHMRPPKAFDRSDQIAGRWRATRNYKVWLKSERVTAWDPWGAEPFRRKRGVSRTDRGDVP